MVTFATMDFTDVRAGERSDMDYPSAWAIQKEVGPTLTHQPRCSSVPGWDPISGPGILCDCGAVETEYLRRKGETTMAGRFEYVQYDQEAINVQTDIRSACEVVETLIQNRLRTGRAQSVALTKLEELYMWAGKQIRDDQIARASHGSTEKELK